MDLDGEKWVHFFQFIISSFCIFYLNTRSVVDVLLRYNATSVVDVDAIQVFLLLVICTLNIDHWRLKYTKVQSQQMAFTQVISEQKYIPIYYLIVIVMYIVCTNVFGGGYNPQKQCFWARNALLHIYVLYIFYFLCKLMNFKLLSPTVFITFSISALFSIQNIWSELFFRRRLSSRTPQQDHRVPTQAPHSVLPPSLLRSG